MKSYSHKKALLLLLLLCLPSIKASESASDVLKIAKATVWMGTGFGLFYVTKKIINGTLDFIENNGKFKKKAKGYEKTQTALDYISDHASDEKNNLEHITPQAINKLKIEQRYKDSFNFNICEHKRSSTAEKIRRENIKLRCPELKESLQRKIGFATLRAEEENAKASICLFTSVLTGLMGTGCWLFGVLSLQR